MSGSSYAVDCLMLLQQNYANIFLINGIKKLPKWSLHQQLATHSFFKRCGAPAYLKRPNYHRKMRVYAPDIEHLSKETQEQKSG